MEKGFIYFSPLGFVSIMFCPDSVLSDFVLSNHNDNRPSEKMKLAKFIKNNNRRIFQINGKKERQSIMEISIQKSCWTEAVFKKAVFKLCRMKPFLSRLLID